jgi:uncharacterized protein with GYD domain
MATYVVLVKMTDEGAKNIRDLPNQAEANMARGSAWASRCVVGI